MPLSGLRMPVPRPRGGTNLSPWPCLGGASGQDPHTWTYPIRTHRRTRTHLNRDKARASVGWQCGAWAAPPRSWGTSYSGSPATHEKGTVRCSHPRAHGWEDGGVQGSQDLHTHSEVGQRHPRMEGILEGSGSDGTVLKSGSFLPDWASLEDIHSRLTSCSTDSCFLQALLPFQCCKLPPYTQCGTVSL